MHFFIKLAMYTNLTVPCSNPELTPMIPMLEYIVDNNELHNFALQIARGILSFLIDSVVLHYFQSIIFVVHVRK